MALWPEQMNYQMHGKAVTAMQDIAREFEQLRTVREKLGDQILTQLIGL